MDYIKSMVKFNDDEIDLYNFCDNWFNQIIETYGYCKVDIGRYLGIFPLQVNRKVKKVYFNIDYVKPPTWKDWFIEDEDTNIKRTYLEFKGKES